jgi:hypothetical protein
MWRVTGSRAWPPRETRRVVWPFALAVPNCNRRHPYLAQRPQPPSPHASVCGWGRFWALDHACFRAGRPLSFDQPASLGQPAPFESAAAETAASSNASPEPPQRSSLSRYISPDVLRTMKRLPTETGPYCRLRRAISTATRTMATATIIQLWSVTPTSVKRSVSQVPIRIFRFEQLSR